MANYWLPIMAIAFAAAMALWIALVFRAGQHRPGAPQESEPHREVMGGAFEAREGGRQVMPDPESPLVPEPRPGAARQAPGTADARQTGGVTVPEQGTHPVPEQAPVRGESR